MNNENCLANILKAIVVLQNNAEKIDCTNNSCTRPFLGDVIPTLCFNTRLVTFYRCDNTLITLPYTLADGTTGETSVFRVESVNDNSITVLLLADDGTETYNINTNTFATINLGCVCAIRCIGDTTINNV